MRKLCFPTSTFKQLTTPRGIFNVAMPTLALGLLIFTICFWTCGDYSLNVSYGDEHLATISDESVLTEATAQVNNALSSVDSATSTITPTLQLSYPWQNEEKSGASLVYNKLVGCNDGIVANACGLYIDDVFFGSAESYDEINALLTSYLNSAKEGFDATTTTTFTNNVQLKTDVYASKTLMSAQELFDSAKSYMSVRLETDFDVEYEKPYSTVYQYDASQPDTYRKVVQAGADGMQKVYYRLVYIDGVQTDAIVKDSYTTKEAVDEIVIVGTQETGTGSGSFIWPVPSAHNISSLFEYRWGSFHSGIDIADIGIYRADIVASDTGVVTQAGWDAGGYGYCVTIDHGNGYTTLYAHCDELYVSVGEIVNQGDVIAAVGSTGYSTGYHLHFEIWNGGTALNPVDYFEWDYTTISY